VAVKMVHEVAQGVTITTVMFLHQRFQWKGIGNKAIDRGAPLGSYRLWKQNLMFEEGVA
jgi:hypothetical protein